ncbi:MAG: HNH endonuclease [Vampirovibrionales bacterium]
MRILGYSLPGVTFGVSSNALKRYAKKHSVRCAYGGELFSPTHRISAEHIQPRSEGGTNTYANYLIVCNPCNGKRSNSELRTFVTPEVYGHLIHYLRQMKNCVVQGEFYLSLVLPTLARQLHCPTTKLLKEVKEETPLTVAA